MEVEKLRTLGIVGLDYCGSTLVSNVLSSMPGVLNVGESHWIIDRNLGCRECHKRPCPVFTTPMLNDLRSCDLSKESWWDVISRHTDAELVISTDKLPKHYDLFGVPDNLLFLYKEPKSNIVSWCKRKFPKSQESSSQLFNETEIEAGIRWWLEISSNILDWLECQEREILVLSLEDFSNDPRGMAMSLCGSLGIEFDPTSINFWNRDLHYIGGNHSVKRLSPNKHFYQKIVVDERWRNHLTDIAAEKIDQDVENSTILNRVAEISNKGQSSFFRLP